LYSELRLKEMGLAEGKRVRAKKMDETGRWEGYQQCKNGISYCRKEEERILLSTCAVLF